MTRPAAAITTNTIRPDMWVRISDSAEHFAGHECQVLSVLDTVATVLMADGGTVRRAWVYVGDLQPVSEVTT